MSKLMSDERLKEIRQRLNNARLSHPAGSLPAMGDLQALQECVTEIDRLREALREKDEILYQFCQVAGLEPIRYPKGRRLPDAELRQDPAFLAFVLWTLESEVAEAVSETDRLREQAKLDVEAMGDSLEAMPVQFDFSKAALPLHARLAARSKT